MKTQDGEPNHSHNHYGPTHNAIKAGRNAFSVWEDFILKRATLIRKIIVYFLPSIHSSRM